MRLSLRALDLATRRGGVVRELASRADAVRGLGLRGAWERVRTERELAASGNEPWDTVYLRIWSEAANELGASVHELGGGFLELRRGDAVTRVWQQFTELDGPVALQLALDRRVVFRLLQEADVPIPEHLELEPTRADLGIPFLAGGPCVVKPAAGTGVGSGITSGITNEEQLRRALLRAARYGTLMLERQVPGTVYRFLYLDGELLDAVRKLPPSVVGDGRSTIEELVRRENRRRLEAGGSAGFSMLKLDLDALFTLEAAGLDARSVPSASTRIIVKNVTNQNSIEDNQTVRPLELADELVAEGAAAAAATGLRLAGVDLVTPDSGASLRRSGGRVIEVNGMPGLNHHYNVSDRANAIAVAVPILAALLGTKA
jgi:D-alanine-D-alanine ligase-like ATP-grasp enzyme